MKIGVLSVQGAFVEHLDVLRGLGVDAVAVRLPKDLDGVSALVLPGGESTTMRKLIDRWGLREPILDLARQGAPLLGTCAGMIILSKEILDGDEPVLPLLDVSVKRNAFGRQLDSFEAEMDVPVLGDAPVHGVFIRAPIIERVGPGVDVLATLDDGRIVAVRERNVIATAFHPELAGETRFHRLLATMATDFAEPGEGAGRRRHPDPADRPMSGRVRSARLTDLSALGELSRISHAASDAVGDGQDGRGDARVRSLGLPISTSAVSVFSLFRMPLGAFQPHDQLYVYEDEHRLAGLARVEREASRDEWTIVELDAVDHGDAGDIRLRLLQHLLRDGGRRGASRVHVACHDGDGNVELFMQAGFARYGEERILARRPGKPLPALIGEAAAADLGIRPATPIDALQLSRLYLAATPAPVARLEGYRLPDWERQGTQARVPRSALTPILRFADVEAFVQSSPPPASEQLSAFVQIAVAKEDQPHYVRVISRPDHDPSALIGYGLAVIGERSGTGPGRRDRDGLRRDNGIVTAVRTYESPIDRRLEEFGFGHVADVTLLLRETLVRVAEPALVPATR